MSDIQKSVEGLIPTIQSLSYDSMQINAKVAELEKQLSELPEVIKLKEDINFLKKSLLEKQSEEQKLREQGKEMMLMNGVKKFTMLDGTEISINATPGALVIEEGVTIPEEFWRVKKEVDKVSLKKAFNEGKIQDAGIYIQQDYKFIIKNK